MFSRVITQIGFPDQEAACVVLPSVSWVHDFSPFSLKVRWHDIALRARRRFGRVAGMRSDLAARAIGLGGQKLCAH